LDKDSKRGLKTYNAVVTSIYQLITTILIGYGIGWLIDRPNDSTINRLIFTIVFSLIGIANFFYQMIRMKNPGGGSK